MSCAIQLAWNGPLHVFLFEHVHRWWMMLKNLFSLPLIELVILAKPSITLSNTILFHYHGLHHVQLMEFFLTPITFSTCNKNLPLHETLMISNTLYYLLVFLGYWYSHVVGILLIISTNPSINNPHYYIPRFGLYSFIITLSPYTLGRWHHCSSKKLTCVWYH